MNLRATWKRTKAYLNDARCELPIDPVAGEEGGTATTFQEFLDHNELELALDELEGMAATNPSTTHFWFSLRAAASEMKLEQHRDRYSKILDRNEPLLDYDHEAVKNSLCFGVEKVDGFADEKKQCGVCGQVRFYHDKFDAYFCAFCNQWLESFCSDPRCDYCRARPNSPLENRANKVVSDVHPAD